MPLSLRTMLLVAAPAAALSARPARAQTRGWQGTAELGGNVWYGAAHARVVSAGVTGASTDSTLQLHGEFRFGYADDRQDEEPRRVTARSAQASSGLDFRPFERYSPFLLASAESNLQQRIALRVNIGAGAKLTLMHKNRDDPSVSLALLDERTRALPDRDVVALQTRTRWSLRARYRRQLTPDLYISHVTFYQPALEHTMDRYTIDATTSAEMTITGAISLTATLRHRYDSEARQRGADDNTDGQFLVGLRAHF